MSSFTTGLTNADNTPSKEETCFTAAFNNMSWVGCVSPLLPEIQGEFNVTNMW